MIPVIISASIKNISYFFFSTFMVFVKLKIKFLSKSKNVIFTLFDAEF